MDTAAPVRTETTARELVSGVADLRRVPLAQLVRARETRSAPPAAETGASEFNSSI